jgi:hypothetical protein
MMHSRCGLPGWIVRAPILRHQWTALHPMSSLQLARTSHSLHIDVRTPCKGEYSVSQLIRRFVAVLVVSVATFGIGTGIAPSHRMAGHGGVGPGPLLVSASHTFRG